MDPISTVLGLVFLFGLVLIGKLVVDKLRAWSLTPGAFRADLRDWAPEAFIAYGFVFIMAAGPLLHALVDWLFFTETNPMSRQLMIQLNLIGFLPAAIVYCWLSNVLLSQREKRRTEGK